MPWKETCIVNERIKLIGEYLSGGYSVSELARRYGVSRKAVYKWIERHGEEGPEGLKDRTRAPHHHPQAVKEEVVKRILELKAQWPKWGAPKLLARLRQEIGRDRSPAESTVSEILRRHGLSFRRKKRRKATYSETPLKHCWEANDVWSADFKGWFRTGDGSKCTPLTITDNYSRYLLRCQGLGDSTDGRIVKLIFESAFQEYGMPESIRTDNGSPFASTGLCGLTRLNVWWLRLGIELERIEPGNPQQNGRHERMHRTLKENVINPAQRTLRQQQEAFDRFQQEYNEERPHEALEQRPPIEFYAASRREYPSRLPDPREYPEAWERRTVRKGGQMKWRGQDVRISDALWGERVGLEPTDDGIWTVWFESMPLGRLDERQKRVILAKQINKQEN